MTHLSLNLKSKRSGCFSCSHQRAIHLWTHRVLLLVSSCLFFPAGGCKCVRPTKISNDGATWGWWINSTRLLHPDEQNKPFRLNRSCSLCCVWVGCVCISLLPLTLLFSVYFLRSFPSLPAFLRPSSSSSFCLLRLILRVFSCLSLSRLKMM